MIRQLSEPDRETVLEYLATEPAHTVFFVADIRDFGFDDPRFGLWGADSTGIQEPFDYVFCLFYGCVHVYSKSDSVDVATNLRYINDHAIDFKMIAGKETLVMPFAKRIPFQSEHHSCLAELRQENFSPHVDESITTEWASANDAEEILRLRTSIPEFQDLLMPLEQLADMLVTGKGRVLNIRESGRIVSSATESCLGRIGYVCTDPAFRGRGYASLLVSKLSETVLSEGLVPSLGYENPAAGRIYQRLGFREIGKTVVLTK